MIVGAHTYGEGNIALLWNRGLSNLIIGKYCSIASGIKVYLSGNHPTNRATTFPLHVIMENKPKSSWGETLTPNRDVTIGNDVWIGENVTIMSGATIGNGAVIGACSVVRGIILPYTISIGNPCYAHKYRFPPFIQKRMEEIQWWNWTDEQVIEAIPLLESEDFTSLYEYWRTKVC